MEKEVTKKIYRGSTANFQSTILHYIILSVIPLKTNRDQMLEEGFVVVDFPVAVGQRCIIRLSEAFPPMPSHRV